MPSSGGKVPLASATLDTPENANGSRASTVLRSLMQGRHTWCAFSTRPRGVIDLGRRSPLHWSKARRTVRLAHRVSAAAARMSRNFATAGGVRPSYQQSRALRATAEADRGHPRTVDRICDPMLRAGRLPLGSVSVSWLPWRQPHRSSFSSWLFPRKVSLKSSPRGGRAMRTRDPRFIARRSRAPPPHQQHRRRRDRPPRLPTPSAAQAPRARAPKARPSREPVACMAEMHVSTPSPTMGTELSIRQPDRPRRHGPSTISAAAREPCRSRRLRRNVVDRDRIAVRITSPTIAGDRRQSEASAVRGSA